MLLILLNYISPKIQHSVIMLFMANSVINKQTLDKISGIFPCVIWDGDTAPNGESILLDKKKLNIKDGKKAPGYFNANTDTFFHKQLNRIVSNNNSEYDIIKEFYNFGKNNPKLSDSKKNIFNNLLPPQDEFDSIDKIQTYNVSQYGGLYFFFNEFFTQAKFETEFFNISKRNLDDGPFFPKNKIYNKPDWVCFYNNNGPRFTWDKERFLNKKPNPWDGFKQFCQFYYTLVNIGFEEQLPSSPFLSKSEYSKNGHKKLLIHFKLEKKRNNYSTKLQKKVEYELSDRCILLGNIEYGIGQNASNKKTGRKKGLKNENVFHIKNFEETVYLIKQARFRVKYEEKNVLDFTRSQITSINRLYDKYCSTLKLPNISKKEVHLRFEKLSTILTFITTSIDTNNNANTKELKRDKNSILRLQDIYNINKTKRYQEEDSKEDKYE